MSSLVVHPKGERVEQSTVREPAAVCAAILELADELDRREPMGPEARIRAWRHGEEALRSLAVVVGQMRWDATDALAQLGEDQLGTDLGPVHMGWRPGRQEWRGYELLDRLGMKVIDPMTGEMVDAVPVDVLRDVLPACSKPETTSSRWSTTGLDRWLPDDWQVFRNQHDGQRVITIGERPRR